jgi:hypothetical protein
MFKVPNQYRDLKGPFSVDESAGNKGVFIIPHPKIKDYYFAAIASDGFGWEHVSIVVHSKKIKVDRCPTWGEMCFLKDLFWDGTDCVVQFHPPESEYVNNHPNCLHLWRPTDQALPLPDSILVGIK